MFGQVAQHTFDITDVGHIERIVVGTVEPDKIPTEQENANKMALINRCLTEFPKGRIIGTERSFSLVRIGEHQVVLECVAYHIGFKKRPLWMIEEQASKQDFKVDQSKLDEIIVAHSQ
ncbi:hypothetical protein [Pseudoalteromonas xiamenensis]|uniref:Uncharacterized protein n=1 Tax=Pseudoalteromonas xiamenensis TaxID=882626 RepID=A0A975HJZ0_9GAMM|nr:hypothetical protein [Pseudoalteromonas xiamenensis]QTH70419.1 hypothetical protein J5O05_10440 [Pseudoalteromonas xiamenensis]